MSRGLLRSFSLKRLASRAPCFSVRAVFDTPLMNQRLVSVSGMTADTSRWPHVVGQVCFCRRCRRRTRKLCPLRHPPQAFPRVTCYCKQGSVCRSGVMDSSCSVASAIP